MKALFLQFGTPRSNQAMLGVHYDTSSNEEAFYNGQGQRLLSVKYKNGLLPIQWSSGSSHNCTQSFDRYLVVILFSATLL